MLMLDSFFGLFSHELGIDLGTSNTRVLVKDKGIMVREPSVVVRQKKTKEIIDLGSEAKKMIGKTPVNLEVVKPLHDGVIADFDATVAMLSHYLKQVHQSGRLIPMIPKPKVVASIPSGVTGVERKAVQDALLLAGARMVDLIEEPMAAAIGADLKVAESQGILLVNIGGGVTDMAVISLGGIVQGRTLKIAGEEMTAAVGNFLRLKYSLLVGELTAEEVKIEIGSALQVGKNEDKSFIVRGRGLETGLPVSLKVQASEIREALAPIVNQIVLAVSELVESTPPELMTDISKAGICLCGGGAKLMGLDRLIFETTKIPAWVAENPLDCTVKGCGQLLIKEKLLKKVKVTGGLK